MINIDSRTRIVIVIIVSTAAVIMKDIIGLTALLLLTLLYCRLFSISLFKSTKKLKNLWYVFIILAFIQSIFTHGGNTLISIGKVRILTTYGLKSGISIIIRMAIIIYSAMIIASAGTLNLIYGLIAMKLPYEIAYMVLLAIKFLPIFKEELMDSIIAVQLAGADLKRIPLGQKLSLYYYILTPSLINALKRARYISISMECRGFRAQPNRTSFCKLQMGKADYMVILATLALTIIILFFHYEAE